jgi:hypothetical protein
MKYLVDFNDSCTQEQITEYFNSHGCSILKDYQNFDKVYLVEAAIEPPITKIVVTVTDNNSNGITLLGDIIYADKFLGTTDPNLPSATISTTDEKDWWKNFVLNKPDFNASSVQISRRGEHANIYLMDSGIMKTHPDLVSANITDLFSITPGFADTSGHGTALTSVMVGQTCGLTNAKIKNVKIFDNAHQTTIGDLLSAFDAVLTDFYANPGKLAIVNCSWSITKNLYIEQKIQFMIDAGIVVVASAGNSGVPIDNVTPASMADVITIGAFNQLLNPSDFSNYTDPTVTSLTQGETNSGHLDGWAPGEKIYVAALNGGFGYTAGTSFAAAIASSSLAYNMYLATLPNGEVLPTYINARKEDLLSMCTNKEGLLDLSDPKYSTSINKVVVLINQLNTQSISRNHMLNVVIKEEQFTAFRVFYTDVTEKCEIISDILPGFTIYPNGLMVGKVSSAELNGNDVREFSSTLLVTFDDGSTSNFEIRIGVTSTSVDNSQVTFNDPLLQAVANITPQDANCYITNQGPQTFCTDFCSQFGQFCLVITDNKGIVVDCIGCQLL